MEKLAKNHPRFCTRYILHVGIANEVHVSGCRVLELEGQHLHYQNVNRDLGVGDKALIAKRIAQPGRQWTVHEVVLAEDYWYYEHFMELSVNEQRAREYVAHPRLWFSHQTRLVEPASKAYIARHLGY